VVLDIDGDKAEETAVLIGGLGVRTMAVPCDITDVAAVRTAVDAIVDTMGSVDILVNNAGIDKSRFFEQTDEKFWRLILDVCYVGTLAVTHAVLPHMIAQKSGVIVNMGSDAGRVGNPGDVVYSGAKAAVMASSKALAREVARHNIRVNCVSPGPVETELWANLFEEGKGEAITEAIKKTIPMRRLGRPDDVADVVAFFCSDDSRYLTGQILSVDGGMTMVD
jgi:2-hydroxycyclohexanecarboxyl-CoA dehydrogenase